MPQPPPPRFGTDGLRGAAGQPPLDPPTLRRVGAALGAWLRQSGGDASAGVAIGHDGRGSATWIRQALVAGLSTADVPACDLGLVTTPALAFAARAGELAAGIMISASHNPPGDNGVKVFGGDGLKLADAAERAIERLADTAPDADLPAADGRCEHRPDLVARYEDFLIARFAGLDLRGAAIVVDAANGGGSQIAPRVLARLGATVVAVACAPDGTNINCDSGALHPESAAKIVRARRARLGLCLDGDGDRGIVVDDSGVVRDGDEVMAVLARLLKARGQLPGDTVVATVMSNLGLHKVLQREAIAVHTTPVGDRAVVQAMLAGGYALGGEQSGHIVFREEGHCTGDGLFTALQLLALAPPAAARTTAAWFAGFKRYPQVLLNVPVARKPDLASLPEVQQVVASVEERLGAEGRVLLRYSGTESLCRVMVEGPEPAIVLAHAKQIADAVRHALK